MNLCEQLGSGMKRILESYGPEDFEISENFVVASFKYNEHALAVMNEEKGSGKVRERFRKGSPAFPQRKYTCLK